MFSVFRKLFTGSPGSILCPFDIVFKTRRSQNVMVAPLTFRSQDVELPNNYAICLISRALCWFCYPPTLTIVT